VMVYAGGDDVLALLPVDRALDCAAALEHSYRDAFKVEATLSAAVEGKVEATLSAAVVFAHARAPLDLVLGSAHRLLDEVAKEANGRASLVVAVTRRSDPTAQWVTTWQRSGASAVQAITELARTMATDQRLLSGALDHAIWELLRRLGGGVDWKPGTFARIDAGLDLDLAPLIRAAVMQSLSHRSHRDVDNTDTEADRLTELIHLLLAPARNKPARRDDLVPTDAARSAEQEVGLDALLVARFLAGGGLEGEHQS
jgi:CRISPR-associated protein Cmr2